MPNKPLIDDPERLKYLKKTAGWCNPPNALDPDELAQLIANTEALREVRDWAMAQAQCDDWGGENGREILIIINRHGGKS